MLAIPAGRLLRCWRHLTLPLDANMTSLSVIFLYFRAAWVHSAHKLCCSSPFPSRSLTLLSVIRILKLTRTGVPFQLIGDCVPSATIWCFVLREIPVTRGCQAHVDTFVCVTTHLATALPMAGSVRSQLAF